MSTSHPRALRRIPIVIVSLVCHAVVVALLIAGATRTTLKKPEPSTFCCVAALEVAGGSQAARSPMPVAPAASRYTKQPLAQEPLVRPTTPPLFQAPARQPQSQQIGAPTPLPATEATPRTRPPPSPSSTPTPPCMTAPCFRTRNGMWSSTFN
jgi:hypothetical protein